MDIFIINLDRQAARWARLSLALGHLPTIRIPAIDGRRLPGPEVRDKHRQPGYDGLTRYERALIDSHRTAWAAFLASGEPNCCVLEDDVCLSPGFADFVVTSDWVPADADVVKIETFSARTYMSRTRGAAFGRHLHRLSSAHLGTAGYVLTRRGATALLPATIRPAMPLDHVMFDAPALTSLRIYQVSPALCIQADRLMQDVPPELRSSIQAAKPMKSAWDRVRAEVRRPFRHLGTAARRTLDGTYTASAAQVVPFL